MKRNLVVRVLGEPAVQLVRREDAMKRNLLDVMLSVPVGSGGAKGGGGLGCRICMLLRVDALAAYASDAVEPSVPPVAHEVACLPDEVVVRVPGRDGVEELADALRDVMSLHCVAGCPWCCDEEAVDVDPSFELRVGRSYVHQGVACLFDRLLLRWADLRCRWAGECAESCSVQRTC